MLHVSEGYRLPFRRTLTTKRARMTPRPSMSPLAIVLPHPGLPRRRSSMLSAGSCASPHTPRSCVSPTLLFAANNRKSSDSWGSSIQDIGDDLESEWLPEHLVLLERTLDALPEHLFTPYVGKIPPPNLIEKVARGIVERKGTEWTHSVRATRLKLFEIARNSAIEQHRRSLDSTEEFDARSDDKRNVAAGKRPSGSLPRPLYRQSSMDFINPSVTSLRDTDPHSKLSGRTSRSDQAAANSNYHPYSRRTRKRPQDQNERSISPPRLAHIPSLISPSSQSLSTRNSISSLSSISSRPRRLSKSSSTLSRSSFTASSSDMGSSIPEMDDAELDMPMKDPRVQRVRRSESFGGPPTTHIREGLSFTGTNLPTLRQGVKRSPSYGVFATDLRKRGPGLDHPSMDVSSSSDEEERARERKAKKSKKSSTTPKKEPQTSKEKSSKYGVSATADGSPIAPVRSKPRMNLQRNPSMFGAELPNLHMPTPVRQVSPPRSVRAPSPPPTVLNSAKTSPPRTLRRVKRLAPSRKIEFGAPLHSDDTDADGEFDGQELLRPPRRLSPDLGSAFQLK